MDAFNHSQRNFKEGHCDKTECIEMVEAMLNTALLQQEDLWNLLMSSAPQGVPFNQNSGDVHISVEIALEVLMAMKSKVENAMSWCQLAKSRLQNIVPE